MKTISVLPQFIQETINGEFDPRQKCSKKFIVHEITWLAIKAASVFGSASVAIWMLKGCAERLDDHKKLTSEKIYLYETLITAIYLILTLILRPYRYKHELAPLFNRRDRLWIECEFVNADQLEQSSLQEQQPLQTQPLHTPASLQPLAYVIVDRDDVPSHAETESYKINKCVYYLDTTKDRLFAALFGFAIAVAFNNMRVAITANGTVDDGCLSHSWLTSVGFVVSAVVGFWAGMKLDGMENTKKRMEHECGMLDNVRLRFKNIKAAVVRVAQGANATPSP